MGIKKDNGTARPVQNVLGRFFMKDKKKDRNLKIGRRYVHQARGRQRNADRDTEGGLFSCDRRKRQEQGEVRTKKGKSVTLRTVEIRLEHSRGKKKTRLEKRKESRKGGRGKKNSTPAGDRRKREKKAETRLGKWGDDLGGPRNQKLYPWLEKQEGKNSGVNRR